MKKNYLLGMFAATGMLLATSCSNDELEAAQSGNEAQVTFSLGLENGIGSRAISDGTKADKLVYAVYNSNGEALPVFENGAKQKVETIVDITGKAHEVSITLAKGQTYQVAFWAQDDDCTAYNTADLTNVVVDYTAVNNAEVRDAFFKTVEFTVAGNKTIDVVMKRPFAQINVGVYESDWDAAVASGIEIEKSKVVINNAATSINLLTGAVSGTETVTYGLSAIPDETLEVETDETKAGKEEYKWLSMSYILVNETSDTDADNDGTLGDARTTLESLNYTFSPVSGNPITFTEGLNSVPVQRNWRTNILGKILTGDIQFNITIDPVYDGDIIYPEASKLQEQLEMAATFGGTVTLSDDVTLTKSLNVVADMVIDLNGHTITNPNGYAIENTGNLTISGNGGFAGLGGIRSTGGKITINGGRYTASSDWSTGTYNHILKAENTEVVINGGTFDATIGGTNNAMINVSNGSVVTINDGEFRNVAAGETIPQFAPYMFTYEGDGKLIINGGDFYGGWRFNGTTATTDIYGGNFTVSYDGQSFHANSTHVLKIYGGTFSTNNGGKLNPTNHLAAGCYVLSNSNGTYTVIAIDAENQTFTINTAEDLLILNRLSAEWKNSFVNGQINKFYYSWLWTIKLNADIDLNGITLNEPINLGLWGAFEGQNHTIKNVTINNADDAGLFNAGGCSIKNLIIDNVTVKGGYSGNATAGILASSSSKFIDNVTITNSSVEGGKYTGGVVGYGYADVTNCTLTNCVVKGGYKLGGVIGYVCAENVTRKIEGNALTDCAVQGAGQYADGKSKYIAGRIVGNYNCNGTCENNVVENMTTIATANIGEIEAGMVVAGQNTTVVDNTSELQTALALGETVVLTESIAVDKSEAGSNGYGATGISQTNGGIIDGNGNEISVNAWTTWDSAINTTGGIIKNVNVTGGMRGIFINHNSTNTSKVILENVTIDGTVYTISCDQGTNKGLEAYNSTFNGWTSYAATIGDVKFVDCKFGEGQGYAYCRPYAPTEFIGCEFAAGFELDAVAAVSFENCTIGGVALTDANLSTLVTSGIANATVK